ncbi:amidohydrolase [Hyphococcus luteus]|uniref:Amidohydrolase n=1 Tax=Hyphococcus luteus TaxID=2058213 RepID=A0A2S7K3Q1_9PROT|nr:amidohydrolase [Marinicaulis flavus]PQA87068.1 amidohydrolase [Marinicaulis flavus]
MPRFAAKYALFALALPALAACGGRDAPSAGAAPEEAAKVVIFTGGPIYTGVEGAPTAEAVAVAGSEIVAVGDRALVEDAAGDAVELVELDGAALYPGFTDAHAHLLGIGMRELTLNLEEVGSIAELVSIIEANVQHAGEGETVYGRGWIETGWPEGRMPTRDDLDPVSPDNPVLLTRADGHALVANSAALGAAGIDGETPDPDGGKIERDETGRATGILIDKAQGLVRGLLGETSEAKKREGYAKASAVYTSYGWTGVHAMSVDPANVDMMEALSDEGVLKLRSYNAIDREGLPALIESGPRINENGHVVTRAIKLYMDGALGSRGAALMEPYSDRPDTSGLLLMQKDEAMPILNDALEAGVQVCTHAIGDRGNKLMLDWYEEAFAAHPDKTDMRWRDEHTQILRTEDIPRFAELGVIPSMEPSHAIGDLYFAVDRLGPDRLDGAYAWRALIDAGSIIAGGSDAPVERGDPRIEFYAAVARRGIDGYQDENWRPDQAVTREEALKMFTIWPAYAAFQEDMLGTIEPGKKADFTVFSKDIMTIPEKEILTVEPVMTVVDGEIVFDGR